LDGVFRGHVTLDDWQARVDMKDSQIYSIGSAAYIKACNVDVELPFELDDVLKDAEAQRKEMQLAKIQKAEEELAAMRAAFEKSDQSA
jgi:hypothetical protein